MEKEILLCDCHSIEHQLVFICDNDEEYKTVFMYAGLNKPTFFQRLKYLFGFQRQAFQEFIFNPDKLQKIVDYLKK